MKKLIAILLMLVTAQRASAQFTVPFAPRVPSGAATVSYSNACTGAWSSGTTITCTLSGVTTGQTIYIEASLTGASGYVTATLADSLSTPTVTLANYVIWGNGNGEIWQVTNTTAGTHVLTLTASATLTTGSRIVAVLLSNASTTSPTDSVAALAYGNYTSTQNSGNVTASASGEFLLGFCFSQNYASMTSAGSPQTMTAVVGPLIINGGGDMVVTGNASSTGSKYWTCNIGTSDRLGVNLIAVH